MKFHLALNSGAIAKIYIDEEEAFVMKNNTPYANTNSCLNKYHQHLNQNPYTGVSEKTGCCHGDYREYLHTFEYKQMIVNGTTPYYFRIVYHHYDS